MPNYNPRDIIRNIRRKLRGEEMEDMAPWFKGFAGSIKLDGKEPGRYEVTGFRRPSMESRLVLQSLLFSRILFGAVVENNEV